MASFTGVHTIPILTSYRRIEMGKDRPDHEMQGCSGMMGGILIMIIVVLIFVVIATAH
jgi:hypothetical protein